ncbi:major facilitator superfamily mfs-1 [Trichoderma arundinaceum]|uniref:Major facilitator superfamily mfs-1 n=1 Tax=Trichoderma arundinaceum TaxID=490622 RepID=A0A395NMW8_TRIAR|nr:major facilitator superfamily mfs-1 [Trichoderma arundinaceum]
MKPTYHLPPNFSTPPAPAGPFHLGTVIRNFNRREQMRPLNQSAESRIPIINDQKYHDQKGGFEANRLKLKSGTLGIWANLFKGEKKLIDELHTAGATFVDDDKGDNQEQHADNFTIAFDEDSGPTGYTYQTDSSADGAVEEHWVFPAT